ncbi:toprim domain-containing protein [Pedococcus sp. 5OH_020]|uniref:toprim domain-containing protein n=1 Tax=Pedococcus sp. 5OH_020 TaxID=2989814 RepID=UPI0022E9EFC0|nr:toprim domain-containing protein [Pedococcus sp. 5OH_020]
MAHDYGDFRLVRSRHPVTLEKSLVWERRDRAGAWIPGLGGAALADLPLYEERQVKMGAAAGDVVVLVESESCVDALMAHGIYATTWAGGASHPNLDRIARVLRRAKVVVIPDNDEPGQRCAERIIEHLHNLGTAVGTVVPGGKSEDARDMLKLYGAARLSELVHLAAPQSAGVIKQPPSLTCRPDATYP